MRRPGTRWLLLLAVLTTVLASPALVVPQADGATGTSYAPVGRPGPALSVPSSTLSKAMSCDTPLQSTKRPVILFVPPTILDPQEGYGWDWYPRLRKLGLPYCSVTFPQHSDADIQVSAEYVVYAIRRIYAATGRKVVLFGWSQGASTAPRWALRWWPDARAKVSSLVGIAPDNNSGATIGAAICAMQCPPAIWQESVTLAGRPAHFMTAMNSGQATFPGIAYTAIYSYTDEVAGLNIGPHPVAPLPVAPNVLNVPIQSMCPGAVFEHLTIPASSIAYAIAIRALEDPGKLPDLATIDRRSTCARLWMPGVSTSTVVANLVPIGLAIGPRLLQGDVTSEPPLKCYVYLSGRCPS